MTNAQFQLLVEKIDGLDKRLGGVESGLSRLETRMDGFDAKFELVYTGMQRLEIRMDRLELHMSGLEKQVGDLKIRIDEHDKVLIASVAPLPERFDRLEHLFNRHVHDPSAHAA